MGVTIDESILYMEFYKRKLFDWFHKTDKEAFETAIGTMRKYKKIEQIVKTWNDMNSFDSMKQISEVIEDE